jgi:hypothetical protein
MAAKRFLYRCFLLLFSIGALHAQDILLEPGQRGANALQETVTVKASSIFQSKFSYPSGTENWDIASGDINQDGWADIVSASKEDGRVNVHLNDGRSGVLWQPNSYNTDANNRALCVVDANNDSWPDVVSVTSYGKLCVLLNNKAGDFRRATIENLAWSAHDITPADLNNDGKIVGRRAHLCLLPRRWPRRLSCRAGYLGRV